MERDQEQLGGGGAFLNKETGDKDQTEGQTYRWRGFYRGERKG